MINRSDFDRCFESALLGNRQATILHKFKLESADENGEERWHVCTIDSNDCYSSFETMFNVNEWTFRRPTSETVCV